MQEPGAIFLFYFIALLIAGVFLFGFWGALLAGFVFGFWATLARAKRPWRAIELYLLVSAVVGASAWWLDYQLTGRFRYSQAMRSPCRNNLTNLIKALQNYHSSQGRMPPAVVYDDDGKPMHSWRVLILPFIEQTRLYDAYRMDEPWNGPNNRTLADKMPELFACPGQLALQGANDSTTSYFAVVRPDGDWWGSETPAGLHVGFEASQAVVLLEANELGVNWLEPREFTLEQAAELLASDASSGHVHIRQSFFSTAYVKLGSNNVACAGGNARNLRRAGATEAATALLNNANGDTLPEGFVFRYPSKSSVVVLKWDKIVAAVAFVVLSILPGWAWRQGKLELAE